MDPPHAGIGNPTYVFDHHTSGITVIKKTKDRPTRNLLSSSESESSVNAFDDLSGIAHESASGINLCEVDSLENCLTPRGSDNQKTKDERAHLKPMEDDSIPGLSEVSVPELLVSPNESQETIPIAMKNVAREEPDTNNNNLPSAKPKPKPTALVRDPYKGKANSAGLRKRFVKAETGYLAKSKMKEAAQKPKLSVPRRPPSGPPTSQCRKRIVVPIDESLLKSTREAIKPDTTFTRPAATGPPKQTPRCRSKSRERNDKESQPKPPNFVPDGTFVRKAGVKPLKPKQPKSQAVKSAVPAAAAAAEKISNDVFVDALESNGSKGEVQPQKPVRDVQEASMPEDLLNSCTRTFLNMFHLHVDETSSTKRQEVQSSGGEYASSEEDQVPQQQLPAPTTTKKVSDFKLPTPKASLHARQRSLQQIPHENQMDELLRPTWRWDQSPDIVDVLLVKINIDSPSTDNKTSETKKDVILKFPLHKDDLYSSMVVVQNPMLIDSKVQYVQTPSELVYHVPTSVKTCVKVGIGSFRMRSALNIPVAFKLDRVKNLELIPNVGIILPKESITIRLQYVFRPGLSNLEALKLEGVLVYAAPFVFNKGCGPLTSKLEDVLEFWDKFPGPRFQYAQTKFVQLRVMCQNQLLRRPSTNIFASLWNAFKSLKFIKHVPRTASLPDYTSELLKDKQLSPLGQMMLRRRQAILSDIKETSDQLTETRAFLAATFLLFASTYTVYYYYNQRFLRTELTWWTNLCQWIRNLFTAIEQ